MSFKISWKIHVLSLLMQLVFGLLMVDCIDSIFFEFTMNNNIFYITNNILLNFMIFVVVLFIPITIVHEGIHGMTYKIFGGRVKFGFKGIYAYTEEVSGVSIHRTKFLIILLTPLIVISILSLFIPGPIGSLIFILNLFGSAGDILMAFSLCKTREYSYIVDKDYGFDIINK
ncbi:MAG: DUF3267 domain-containing protein [Clostridiaceae bacterium]